LKELFSVISTISNRFRIDTAMLGYKEQRWLPNIPTSMNFITIVQTLLAVGFGNPGLFNG
jgi:hypothetical protein